MGGAVGWWYRGSVGGALTCTRLQLEQSAAPCCSQQAVAGQGALHLFAGHAAASWRWHCHHLGGDAQLQHHPLPPTPPRFPHVPLTTAVSPFCCQHSPTWISPSASAGTPTVTALKGHYKREEPHTFGEGDSWGGTHL